MFILELVIKDFEGVWIQHVVVSKDKNLLLNRIPEERAKLLLTEEYEENGKELLAVGDLEEFIFEKTAIVRENYKKDNLFRFDGQSFAYYKDFAIYLIDWSTPFAESLGLNRKNCVHILSNSFYASLKFRVSEIEEI